MKPQIIVLTLLLLLSLETAIVGETPVPADEWAADLDTMIETIVKGHKNAYHTISKQELDTAVDGLRRRLPELSEDQRAVEFMRLATKIGDGHTGAYCDLADFRVFPVSVISFDDDLYVVSALDEKLLRARVVSVNGHSVDDIYTAFGEIIPHDNEQSLRNGFQRYFSAAEFLYGSGIIESVDGATFEFAKDGQTFTMQLRPIVNHVLREMKWLNAEPEKKPLYLQKRQLDDWNEWLPDSRTLYFKYNRCQDMAGFTKLTLGSSFAVAAVSAVFC